MVEFQLLELRRNIPVAEHRPLMDCEVDRLAVNFGFELYEVDRVGLGNRVVGAIGQIDIRQ